MAIQKRRTRMYEPWGYREENDYQSSAGMLGDDLEKFFAKVAYDKNDQKIHFYNKDDEEKGTVDVTEFASSVIEDVHYDSTTKILTIKFANGDVININIAELIDENEFADGLIVNDGVVSVLIDSTGDPYLSVSDKGVKLSGVKGKFTQINSAITNINSAITNISGDVVTINSSITEINSAITSISGDVINNSSAITNINSAITEINSAITIIQSASTLWEAGEGENSAVLKGGRNVATGKNAVAEGSGTTANGAGAHAEGRFTTSDGMGAHAEGGATLAAGEYSHAEGDGTVASAYTSHAEGSATKANGDSSHAEGYLTTAVGYAAHAEGAQTVANGKFSHAEGNYTGTKNEAEHASGRWNKSSSASTDFGDSGNTLFSVGNGYSDEPHNAFEIRQNGDIYFELDGEDVMLQEKFKDYYTKQEISEKEEVVADALNDLNDRKFDYAEYVNGPDKGYLKFYSTNEGIRKEVGSVELDFDIDDYYTKQEISIKERVISAALNDLNIRKFDDVQYIESGKTIAFYSTNNGVKTELGTLNLDELVFDFIPWEWGEGENAIQAKGVNANARGKGSIAAGVGTLTLNQGEVAVGQWNASTSSTTEFTWESGNTLFSVGAGDGEQDRWNAFEIRQNGDIYMVLDDEDVKLQDVILEDERVTAEGLNDLDKRTNKLEKMFEENEDGYIILPSGEY